MFARTLNRTVFRMTKRSHTTIKDGDVINGFRQKTTKDIWCGDTGAYPVMGVIGFAVVFCAATGFWFMATSPDARLAKSNRKAPLRGELQHEK